MGSRQSFATPHSRVPGAMIGQYTLKPDTHSNRDTGAMHPGIANLDLCRVTSSLDDKMASAKQKKTINVNRSRRHY